jgi:hypothetical protein
MNDDDSLQRVFWRKKIASRSNEEISYLSKEIFQRGCIRHETDAVAVAFLKNLGVFSPLGYATVDLIPFLREKELVQTEILRRVIWNVGGKKYAPHISERISHDIITKKNNSIGKCLLKINGNRLLVFRENRNLETIHLPQTLGKNPTEILWDNRFLIRVNPRLTGCVIESCSHSNGSSMFTDVDPAVLFGLPWVRQNHRIGRSVVGLSHDDIVFVDKTNLFDVFL